MKHNAFVHLPLFPFLKKTVSGKGRLLMIKDDLIGDLVHISGVFHLYSKSYDTYIVVREEFVPIAALFAGVDKIIPLDIKEYRRNLSYRYNFLNKLRAVGFGVAVGSTTHSTVNNNILKNCGATKMWGYKRNNSIKERFGLWGVNTVESLPLMDGKVYRSVLKHEAWFAESVLSCNLTINDIVPILDKAPKLPIVKPERYIVYLTDARNGKRVYPVDRMIPILEEFSTRTGVSVVATGIVHMELPEGVINLTGATTLIEMISLVHHSCGVVGSESGFAHVSWISKIPTVMVLGGGHYGRFNPLDSCATVVKEMPCFCCDWSCIYDEYPVPCVMADYEVLNRAFAIFCC